MVADHRDPGPGGPERQIIAGFAQVRVPSPAMVNDDPLAFDRALQDYARACQYAMAPGADPAWAVHAQALATEITEGPTGATVRQVLKVARGDTPFRTTLPPLEDTLAFVAAFEIPPLLPGPPARTLDDAIRWATVGRRGDLLTRALYLRAACARIERARNRALERGAAEHAQAIRRHLGSEFIADVKVRSRTGFVGRGPGFTSEYDRMDTRRRMHAARARVTAALVSGYAHGLRVSDLLQDPPAGRAQLIATQLRASVTGLIEHRVELGLRPLAGLSDALQSVASPPPALGR